MSPYNRGALEMRAILGTAGASNATTWEPKALITAFRRALAQPLMNSSTRSRAVASSYCSGGLLMSSPTIGTSYDKRIQLDAADIKNWSTLLDIAILARTVIMVAAQRGAV
jgi:hypothetical protein